MRLRQGWLRRHRVALATNLALVVATGAVVSYAIAADGYQAHKADLNDGGIWVTSNEDGIFGRINKPIDQADGAMLVDPDQHLDIVQQGAAVVGVNRTAHSLTPIDPATVRPVDGSEAPLPGDAEVVMAGGTLAVLDAAAGRVWAARVDPQAGMPQVGALAESSEPLAIVGKGAAITVTAAGVVVAASSETDRMVRLAPQGASFRKAKATDSGLELGSGLSLTAVGERIVFLDGETGNLTVPGGGSAALAPGGVLQQPGAADDSVLVAVAGELLDVHLDSGKVVSLTKDLGGRPTAPVRLGACAFGAWSGGRGEVVTSCDGASASRAPLVARASDLVFRVNRGQILLNDRVSGAVWNVDEDEPLRIDDWDAFVPRANEQEEQKEQENNNEGDRQPPKAKPDQFGARPNRITVLHPLDNDTAPKGRILAIRALKNVTGPGTVSIGPDGQTVQVSLPADAAGSTTFEYFVDDGRPDVDAHATVTVATRGLPANAEPALRDGFQQRKWIVSAGGTLDIPVLPDWRDRKDGDPVSLASAVALGGEQSGAIARTTATGRLRFTAPAEAGVVKVEYAVSDGVSARPVSETLQIQVQGRNDSQAHPPVAEPDIVSGEVGEVISISPLGNDLPGSDPLTPEAVLELAGKVASVGGADIRTDLANGTITFRSRTAKTYFLDYDAAFGSAQISPGRIRVDVNERPEQPLPPVAMPDQVTLFGQSSANVDALANDVDPSGGMLVVQRANAATRNQLDVAVIDGRWIRVSARQGALSPNPQVIRYTISNGHTSGVEGEITVSQRDAVDDNTPVTAVDRVTVRAGSGITVPSLDNDFSPAGDQLQLVSDVAGEASGQLTVKGADGVEEVGAAFVSGRLVRYVAPASVADVETFTIRYVAVNAQGLTAPGRIEVKVVPDKRRNQAPTPPLLEGRAVAGDVVTLRLPGVGVDPDGDAVTLLGLGSGPRLGRIVKYGANSIQYQAYPGQRGTDEFAYRIVDSYGEIAEGTARVAVVPGDIPQPPLPVADEVTVQAGRTARIDAMSNDLIADGDNARIELVEPPPGVSLASDYGPIMVETAAGSAGRTVDVVYRLTNGVDANQSTVAVRAVEQYNNPPLAFDAFGTAEDADQVTVDVLEAAYDPDGDESGLSVSHVFTPASMPQARIDGGRITLARGDQPAVVPFRIEDADGGAASASVYVPAKGNNLPFVRPDALLRLEPGESVTAKLADYVVNPSGGPVVLTLNDRVKPSPLSGLAVSAKGRAGFTVAASKQMSGPGAVIVEVTTGTSANDPEGLVAVLTIPVQVGRTRPIINCPTTPIELPAGEQVPVTILSRCHVWTEDPDAAGALAFTGTWAEPVDGLVVVADDGPTITVAAATGARRGTTGVLEVTAEGSAPAAIEFVVTGGPPPSMTTARVKDLTAGESVTVDLLPYLQPGVGDPVPSVLSVRSLNNPGVRADIVSATEVRLTASAEARGNAEIAVVMSDVARADATPERRVEGRISVEILGHPDTPAPPIPANVQRSQEVPLNWRAPANNGSPIDFYEVRTSPATKTRTCPSTSCDITGLTNGTTYSFAIRAHNAAGFSPWSGASRGATPDSLPGQVGPIGLVRKADHTLKIRWSAPRTSASVDHYIVAYAGIRKQVSSTIATITGLNNDLPYVFKVYAVNKLGAGPARDSPPMQSQGPVGRPAAPSIDDPPGSPDTANLVITWPPVAPNGPGPIVYRVLHNGLPLPGCEAILETVCNLAGVRYDGAKHTFSVGAGVADELPQFGPDKDYYAVGRPDGWGPVQAGPTGKDGEAAVTFAIPNARGTAAKVTATSNGVVVKEFDGLRTGNVTEVLQLGGNGTAYNVQLTLCNEFNRCSQSAPVSVTPYGPLRGADLAAPVAEINGKDVRWRITVNSQGDPAMIQVVGVEGTSGRNETLRASSPGVSELVTGWVTLGYNKTERVSVVLQDDNPQRGPVGVFATSGPTAAPPPASFTLSKAGSCDANDPPSCGYVHVSYSNAVQGQPACTLYVLDGSGNWQFRAFWRLDANSDYDVPKESTSDTRIADSGTRLRLDCSNYGATTEFTWP